MQLANGDGPVVLAFPTPIYRHHWPAVGVYDLPGVQSVSTWTIQPAAGEMLLFPSWLRHGVLPFRGSGERISIAFNLRVGDLRLQAGSR